VARLSLTGIGFHTLTYGNLTSDIVILKVAWNDDRSKKSSAVEEIR
jgi:hypothetical protein